MTLRYLYRLDQLHRKYHNPVEQGYTLQLISEHYTVKFNRLFED